MDVHILCLLIVTLTGGVRAAAPTITTNVKDDILVIPEDKEINSTLYTITINDVDPGDRLKIRPADTLTDSMVWTDYGPEQLITPPYNISVNVRKLFDRDTPSPSVYQLKFQVSDSSNNVVFRTVSVYPSDVNDNAPEFKPVQYAWELPENAPHLDGASSGTQFLEISATDLDNGNNGTVVYEMQPSVAAEYSSTFEINAASGTVNLIKPLDYEKNSYYQFTVVAKDKGTPPLNSSVVFIIRVLDVQDTPPFFTGIPYRANFVERDIINDPVLTITAVDGDSGLQNEINYSILGGPCSDMFTINNNGTIFSTKSVDRDAGVVKEQDNICQLIVEASELDLHPNAQHGATTVRTTVTISVLDVNDNSPSFSGTNFTTQIWQNAPEGSRIEIPNFWVKDIDQGENATMTLAVTDINGQVMTNLEVLPHSVLEFAHLNIRVKTDSFVDNGGSIVRLNVVAADMGMPAKSSTATVTVVVWNYNAPPCYNLAYENHLSLLLIVMPCFTFLVL